MKSILLLTATLASPVLLAAEVDTRPLPVRVELAFPKLPWPERIAARAQGLVSKVRPIIITGAGDGTNRLVVATQQGKVYVFRNDPQADAMDLFLDLTDRVHFNEKDNEEGFLGLAFHPRFKENGQLFVYYTAKHPLGHGPRQSIVSRFLASDNSHRRADPGSEQILLRIDEPYGNHNGGTVVFGPDGYLTIAVGDGGAARDPHMNGQNLQTLLGKILRIDVEHQNKKPARPYAIPPDNPFAAAKDFARGEIWAYGLRNPWRIAFDRVTGHCWAADVGQDTWEEIDIIRRGGNYGWNLREGRHPHGPGGSDARPGLVEPIWEYHHDIGKSITGGNVYRGSQVPELAGAYLYADWVTGQVWALWYDEKADRVTANRTLVQHGAPVATFGEDDQGEIYFGTQGGDLYRFRSPRQDP